MTATVDVSVGQPQVVYRETLSKRVAVLYTHKKFIGGWGEFAEVEIEFEPLPSQPTTFLQEPTDCC